MKVDPEWMNQAEREVARNGFAAFHVDEIATDAPVEIVELLDEFRSVFRFVQVWVPLGDAVKLVDALPISPDQSWGSATGEPTSIYVSATPFKLMPDERRMPFPPLPGQPADIDAFLTYLRDAESIEHDWEYSVGIWAIPQAAE